MDGRNRPGSKWDGSKRKALEGLFADDPDIDYSEAARRVGCAKHYAHAVLDPLRVRKIADSIRQLIQPSDFARVVRETAAYLTVLRERVDEGQYIDPASEFTRWLLGAGVLELCEKVMRTETLAVRASCRDLIMICGERSARRDSKPTAEAASMRSVKEQLAQITASLAALNAKAA